MLSIQNARKVKTANFLIETIDWMIDGRTGSKQQ
jgi:hypothetical protein